MENQVRVIFVYETKTIQVLCSCKEEIKKMFQKFINKVNPESKINEYSFYYEGIKLEANTLIEQNQYIAGKNEIVISVIKNLRLIKCPKCDYNDCIIDLINFKVALYGCEHEHINFTNYDKYFKTQKFELSENICGTPHCISSHQKDYLDYYLCLTCCKMLQKTKSFCYSCNESHKKENDDHIGVKFNDRNYYCRSHWNKFIKYCFNCKKNLCETCVKDHTEHQFKNYELMAPNEKELQSLKDFLLKMKKNISNLKIIINDIIYNLNGTMKIFNNYYEIANDIVGKYELYNKDLKDYNILKSLRNLKFSNNQIMEELDAIINEDDIYKKVSLMIKLYGDKYQRYVSDKMNDTDYKNINDDDWLKEIKNREEKPIKNKKKIK